MKKDYKSPSMEVVKLELQGMLAFSGGGKALGDPVIGSGKDTGGSDNRARVYDDDDWDF